MHQTNDIISSFSSYLFWDVDKSKLEVERSAAYIVERVLEYGQLEDWKLIKQIYGLDRIKDISLNIRYLTPKTLSFISSVLNIDKVNFRCYIQKQSIQEHWIY